MEELAKDVFTAPVSTIFVLAGVLFLFIAVIGKISGKIEPGLKARVLAGVLGSAFISIGLAMNWSPTSSPTSPFNLHIPEPTDNPRPKPTPEPVTPAGDNTPDWDAREKVFRRFYRLDRSRTTTGSGLGLSLVAAVAELHGNRHHLGGQRARPAGRPRLRAETPDAGIHEPCPGIGSATPTPTTDNGLQAVYFNSIDFTGTKVSRVDPTVDFNWNSDSPATGIAADAFTARWTGFVIPRYSQTYTFYTNTDDGARLWVNGQLIIDKWVNHSVTEYSGNITLNAGQKYCIKMEYFENIGKAVAQLNWSSSSQAKQIIPKSQLYTN